MTDISHFPTIKSIRSFTRLDAIVQDTHQVSKVMRLKLNHVAE